MPWDRFEQLVFELAKRDDQAVERLAAPDGGADVLLRDPDGKTLRVWQAKHYTSGQIKWKTCEGSLRRADSVWAAKRVTFAFPVEFTAARIKSFDQRLGALGEELGISVDRWTLSEIISRLDEHAKLKVRFFGSSQEAVIDSVDRTLQAAGRFEGGADLLKRAEAIAKFTENTDPDFIYQTITGGVEGPTPNWEELPYMSVAVGGGGRRVELASWSREGSAVASPVFSFSGDEVGQRAREEVVRALARGEEAVITSGANLRFQAPGLFKELIEEARPEKGELRLSPGEAIETKISIRTDEDKLASSVALRPVPWPEGANASFAGYIGSALLELSITLLEAPTVSFNVRLGGQFGSSADENLELAGWMLAFLNHEEFCLASEALFPGSRELRGDFSAGADAEMLAGIRARRDFYADLVTIEERMGYRFEIPDEFTTYDVDAAATAARVLREGGGTATFERTEGYVENPLEIPYLPEEFRKQGSVDREVAYVIFGERVGLGMARYEIPELRIVEIAPQGDRPDVPARVVLEAADDDQIRFALIEGGVGGQGADG